MTGAGLGSHRYAVFVSGGTAVDLGVFGGTVISGSWTQAGGGSWNVATGGNWSGGTTPNAPGDSAYFGPGPAGASTATVTIDSGDIWVGTLALETAGTGSYLIASSNGTLWFDGNGAPSATLSATGNHVISAPVSVNSPLQVNTAAGSTLTISGSFNGGTPLTVGGGGTFVLSGNGTYTGPTAVTGGTLQATVANLPAPSPCRTTPT